jgi:hypothetical protein
LIVARCCHHIWPPLRYRMQWWLMWLLLLLLLLLLSLQQQLSLLVCLRASSWNTTWPWYQREACLRTDSAGTQQLGVAEACLACATRVNRLPRGLAWPPTLAAGLHVRNRLPIRRTHVTLRICLDRRAIPCTFWMPVLTSVDVHILCAGPRPPMANTTGRCGRGRGRHTFSPEEPHQSHPSIWCACHTAGDTDQRRSHDGPALPPPS